MKGPVTGMLLRGGVVTRGEGETEKGEFQDSSKKLISRIALIVLAAASLG